jgi:hypothetical protein
LGAKITLLIKDIPSVFIVLTFTSNKCDPISTFSLQSTLREEMFLSGMAKGSGTSTFSNGEVSPLRLFKVAFLVFF